MELPQGITERDRFLGVCIIHAGSQAKYGDWGDEPMANDALGAVDAILSRIAEAQGEEPSDDPGDGVELTPDVLRVPLPGGGLWRIPRVNLPAYIASHLAPLLGNASAGEPQGQSFPFTASRLLLEREAIGETFDASEDSMRGATIRGVRGTLLAIANWLQQQEVKP